MERIVIKSYETKKTIIIPIIFLIIGMILFTNPGGVVEFLSYILGGVFLTIGVSKFLSDIKRTDRTTGDNFYSIVTIILGIIFIFSTGTLEFLVRVLLGIWLIINGLNTLLVGINMVKVNAKNTITLIIGLVLLGMGIYTIMVSNLVFSAIGLLLICYGILELTNYIYMRIKR